jgi:hypothetical protein
VKLPRELTPLHLTPKLICEELEPLWKGVSSGLRSNGKHKNISIRQYIARAEKLKAI